MTGKNVYGWELIIDLVNCSSNTFTRTSLENFFTDLCDQIGMEKCEVHYWDDVGVPIEQQQTEPHTKGTSAVCFILTSTIVVHTLDLLGAVYVNIFSCRQFDPIMAERFTCEWFSGTTANSTFVERYH